jgi:hypothetical protein
LQSFPDEANLVAVQRAVSFISLLAATLTGLGCAGTELPLPGRMAGPPDPPPSSLASFAAPVIVPVPVPAPAPRVREAVSPRADAAAFLTLRATPAKDPEPEDRTAAILAADARCPAEMALVDDRVCVDRWEASLLERVPNGGERPWSPYLGIEGHEAHIRAVSRAGVIPQAYISGSQAAGACAASGKRLCAPDEWERACRGPAGTTFPYGDVRRAGVCNDDIRPVHPVAEVGRILGIPGDRLWRDGMNQPLVNQLPNTLLPTGDRAECTNAYGVYDMVGNLHEWVDDPDGTFRGGYYMDTTKNGDGCSYQTTAHDFTYHDYSTGFRCCMDPERVE